MTKKSASERDEVYIGRARRRLVRLWKRLGSTRAVEQVIGVNHGWVSSIVLHGKPPKGGELREKLGLPRVLPSEREQRKVKMETWTIEQYQEWMAKGQTKSKYRNVKTEVDGIVFDSGKEAMRYGELKMLEQTGEIHELALQVPFRLDVDGVHVCDYVADFVYYPTPDPSPNGRAQFGEGRMVVEDVKGKRTEMYRLKKKLMLACHGIEIVET